MTIVGMVAPARVGRADPVDVDEDEAELPEVEEPLVLADEPEEEAAVVEEALVVEEPPVVVDEILGRASLVVALVAAVVVVAAMASDVPASTARNTLPVLILSETPGCLKVECMDAMTDERSIDSNYQQDGRSESERVNSLFVLQMRVVRDPYVSVRPK